MRLHPPTKTPEADKKGSMAGDSALCSGWCPYPLVLARLGLADEAVEAVEQSVMTWQFYCQGFGHYGPYEVFTKDRDERWHTNTVTEIKTHERFPSPAWSFRHFTFEAIPIACAAINEMLLQSYEGFIRLLPAILSDWCGSFMLAAEGGFIVHTQYDCGTAEWVAVESNLGRRCRVVDPWGEADVFITTIDVHGNASGGVTVQAAKQGSDAVIEFDTLKGMLYLLSPAPNVLENWVTEPAAFEANHTMKSLGKAQLGLPKMY